MMSSVCYTVRTHSIPSMMSSVCYSLDYPVYNRTIGHVDGVISFLPSEIDNSSFFEHPYPSYPVEVEDLEGIRRRWVIEGFLMILGISINGLYISNIKLHTSRLLPLLFYICFSTVMFLITRSLSGEITSPLKLGLPTGLSEEITLPFILGASTFLSGKITGPSILKISTCQSGEMTSLFILGILSFNGYLLLQFLCNSPLTPINMRSSLVIRYIHHSCFIPVTRSRRYGISLRFTSILLVISMISTALIPDISLAPRSQTMLSVVFVYLEFELPAQSVSSFSITVDIGLESSDSIDWSHLPPDLARGIVNRMITFKDYIAAIGVSHIWRSACSSISRGPQLPLPALMLSEPLFTDMRTLFSLYDNSHHRLQLSEVRGKRIWGSQHGWVVTLGSRYVTQLVHLMTGNRINLPQIQRLAPQEEWFCLVRKFNLLKDPTDESTFVVIVIFGPMNSLAFTRAAFNRRREGEWVVVANPENLKFKDVAHFNGQIYALCDNGKLVRFEPVAPFANMVQVVADHPQDVGAHRKIYLVESLGNLYGVFRNGFLIPSERRFATTSFFVYKFNFNASAWEEVTHLEGHAFFCW